MTDEMLDMLLRKCGTLPDSFSSSQKLLLRRFAGFAAEECVSILLDGYYWNGSPANIYWAAQDRAAAIRAKFGFASPGTPV